MIKLAPNGHFSLNTLFDRVVRPIEGVFESFSKICQVVDLAHDLLSRLDIDRQVHVRKGAAAQKGALDEKLF